MATRSDAVQVDVRLDRGSPVPLYFQLARALEGAMTEGTLRPGDRLENELSLTERLGLARPTVRQAIQELVRKGLVVRRRGFGTQVVRPAIHRDVRLSSLYDDLSESGRAPHTRVLSLEHLTAATSGIGLLAEILPPDEPVQAVRRLRYADGEPLAILTNHVPGRFALDEGALTVRGLYELLGEQGAQIAIAHQTIGARLATAEEAALLEQSRPLACVTAERIVYDDTGALVELGVHLYRSDRYTVQTSLVG